MPFNSPIPEWYAPGVEPPEDDKTVGHKIDDPLPANWLNWQWALSYEALKELQLKAAERTTAGLIYYISPTGNDSNDGLTSAAPLKTIMSAVSKIPQLVNHAVTINIAAGTYPENVTLWGKTGNGSINLIGNASNPASVTISYIELNTCKVNVAIQGIQLNNSTGKPCCFLNYNSVSDMNKCRLIGNNRTYNGFNGDRANQIISETYISSMQDAVAARWNSSVNLIDMTGADNWYGVTSTHNAKVGINGTVVPALNQFNQAWGGTIDLGWIAATSGQMDIYVSPTGNDANDGLTSGTPLKTIMAAFNRVPHIIRHNVNIRLAPGTYNEDVQLGGYQACAYNTAIRLYGGSNLADAVNYKIYGLSMNKCQPFFYLFGIEFYRTDYHALNFNVCQDFYVDYCRFVASTRSTGNFDGVRAVRSFGTVSESEISNRGSGILAHAGSIVTSKNVIGTGNLQGLCASEGSVIAKAGQQPQGDIAEKEEVGGDIR